MQYLKEYLKRAQCLQACYYVARCGIAFCKQRCCCCCFCWRLGCSALHCDWPFFLHSLLQPPEPCTEAQKLSIVCKFTCKYATAALCAAQCFALRPLHNMSGECSTSRHTATNAHRIGTLPQPRRHPPSASLTSTLPLMCSRSTAYIATRTHLHHDAPQASPSASSTSTSPRGGSTPPASSPSSSTSAPRTTACATTRYTSASTSRGCRTRSTTRSSTSS